MTPAINSSVLERPLRPDLAAFFAVQRCLASPCARVPEQPLVGVLADLARHGRLR